jgi:hypothetical protein
MIITNNRIYNYTVLFIKLISQNSDKETNEHKNYYLIHGFFYLFSGKKSTIYLKINRRPNGRRGGCERI